MRLDLGASGTFWDADRESRRMTSAGTNIKTRITVVCADVNSGSFSCSSLDAILADLVSFSDIIEDHSRPYDNASIWLALASSYSPSFFVHGSLGALNRCRKGRPCASLTLLEQFGSLSKKFRKFSPAICVDMNLESDGRRLG